MLKLGSALAATLAAPAFTVSRQPSYSSVRDDAALDPRLRGHDLRVLLYLDRVGAGDGPLKRSQQAIADALGCARQTVWRSMRRLRDAGYLARLARWAVQAGRVRRLVDALTLVGRHHAKPRPKPSPPRRRPPPAQTELSYVPPTVPERFRGRTKASKPPAELGQSLRDRCLARLSPPGQPARQGN